MHLTRGGRGPAALGGRAAVPQAGRAVGERVRHGLQGRAVGNAVGHFVDGEPVDGQAGGGRFEPESTARRGSVDVC